MKLSIIQTQTLFELQNSKHLHTPTLSQLQNLNHVYLALFKL
jgi:hypothetical protein